MESLSTFCFIDDPESCTLQIRTWPEVKTDTKAMSGQIYECQKNGTSKQNQLRNQW
jgi:hypothetical protein